jgi:hypothetical protein
MGQIVVGVYDSYIEACSAQRALIDAGFPQADTSIYSMSTRETAKRGPRVYAGEGGVVRHDQPVFDQLEQLFARLFRRGEYPPETEDYREVIRRGGAIVSVDASEVQVDLAWEVMSNAGAADIDERAKEWRGGSAGEVAHTLNPLGSSGGKGTSADILAQSAAPPIGTPSTDGSSEQSSRFSSANQQSIPGMQQVTTRTEGRTSPHTMEPVQPPPFYGPGLAPAREPAISGAGVDAGVSAPRTDELAGAGRISDLSAQTPLDENYRSYDDEFRRDYDRQYANTGAPYEEYSRAYQHGATLGQDERYRGYDWPEVESSARENWESTYPESTWERFKAAVRHGWERVTNQRS